MPRVVNAVEDPALKDMVAFSIRRRQPGALTAFKEKQAELVRFESTQSKHEERSESMLSLGLANGNSHVRLIYSCGSPVDIPNCLGTS